jgi:hypothetical protein
MAFSNCSALTEIVLPDNTNIAENYAFQNSGINKITIGENVSLPTYLFHASMSKDPRETFAETYAIEGAGVYVFEDGAWNYKSYLNE